MFTKAVELDPLYARAYAGIADCDSFLFHTTHVNIAIEDILNMSAKALALEGGLAEAHASRWSGHSPSANATKKLKPNSRRRSRSTAIRSRAITFMPVPVSSRANSSRQPHSSHASRKLIPRITSRRRCSIQIYRSLGRQAEMQNAARMAAERAEIELARQPENPRPAYLGAAALITLGHKDRAREWLARALATDPDDIWTQYNVACVYTALGDTDLGFPTPAEVLTPPRRSRAEAWLG